MEASALQHASRLPALPGRSPLLRLQSDERLIAMIRRGHQGAFEALVQRYQSRLLAFCRHMLGSTEDAEDVLQEVFAAAYNAMLADERAINARPWLYRIARNRCLNHLRRPTAAGQDSMDVYERDGGTTTADTVHKREEFRQIVADVQDLPETQRTALLLREIDALSYDQIAQAMETTVPSVKSLLVRARVSLAEAAEARLLSCEEVRLELGQVAEGLARTTPPVRRHLKSCERCRVFRTELRRANRALAAVYPIGALASMKLFVSKLGIGAAGGGSGSGAAGGAGAGAAGGGAGAASGAGAAGGAGVAGGAGAAAGGASGTIGGILSAGGASLATKAAAGLAAAAIVTAGAAEVKQVAHRALSDSSHPAVTAAVPPAQAPPAAAMPGLGDQPIPALPLGADAQAKPIDPALAAVAAAAAKAAATPAPTAVALATTPAPTAPATATTTPTTVTTTPGSPSTDTTQPPAGGPTASPPSDTTQSDGSTVTLPDPSAGNGSTSTTQSTTPPGESTDAPPASPAPPAGEATGTGSSSASGPESASAVGYGPAN